MIWKSQILNVVGTPFGASILMVGIHSLDIYPSVNIGISVCDLPGKSITKTVYSHHPAGLTVETPTADEVFQKYQSKWLKLVYSLEQKTFDKLFPELASSLQAGNPASESSESQ